MLAGLAANPSAFDSQLQQARDSKALVSVFPNLSGDALLIWRPAP